jgi:hypothetical protein
LGDLYIAKDVPQSFLYIKIDEDGHFLAKKQAGEPGGNLLFEPMDSLS